MERLTDKDTNKVGFDAWELCGLDSVCKRDCWKPAPCKIPKIVRRLAELEDKIENGTLVELPAPLGSELWTIEYPTHKRGKETVIVLSAKNATVVRNKYPLSFSNLDMIGKHYFLTREEAEKRLEELKL